jgi:hypothetical protein
MPDVIKERDDANPVRQHPDHFYKRSRTLRWFDYTDHATPRIGRHTLPPLVDRGDFFTLL